ncbi:protein FAM199X-like isoform X1 [Dermacentor albipictus]|uniref:protein FAM199X-like isoform X1 n=2 Tax=Dermacentor albipictus TaxID=60249 RepID=UPI0031FC860F
MIESSALSTSPWNLDFWKDGSTSSLGFEDLLDTEICLPSEILTMQNGPLALERPASAASSGPMDPGFGCWEDFEDLLKRDTSTAGDLDLDEWSLDFTESSEVLSDWSSSGGATTFEGMEGHYSRPRSRRGPSPTPLNVERASSTRSWSSMTSGEQLRTVEALTEAINHRLGLREQLDVLRIIDPAATVDPSAHREFAVDLRRLDDHKLRQIADYVRHNSIAAMELAADKAEVTGESSRKRGRCRQSNSCSASGRSSPASASAPVHKKERCKRPRQRPQQRRRRRRAVQTEQTEQEKAHKQMLKEQRSGLFVREEVLTLTSATASSSSRGNSSHPSIAGTDDEEEEVDILH